MSTTTPLMQQYFTCKAEYPEALLLFQVGDFYELFFDDAVTAARVLNITLTQRGTHAGAPIPLCGVPVHVLELYLAKLVKAGFNVAICEQLEPAQPGKMVRRGITRVLTPGTLTDSNLLDDKTASYLLSFVPQEQEWGLVFGELLTAQLYATKLSQQLLKALEFELGRFFPAEILVPDSQLGAKFTAVFKQLGYFTSVVPAVNMSAEAVLPAAVPPAVVAATNTFESWLQTQFDQATQQMIQAQPVLQQAVANFYQYLARRQAVALTQFKTVKFYAPEDFLVLDQSTQLHLELFKNSFDQTRQHTLLAHLDQAVTPMGSRLLAKWLARPLVNLSPIQQRQAAVQQLLTQPVPHQQLRRVLTSLGDLERVVGRIALRRAGLPDYLQLLSGLQQLPQLGELLAQITKPASKRSICVCPRSSRAEQSGVEGCCGGVDNSGVTLSNDLLVEIQANLGDFSALAELLARALNTDPTQSWLIKAGFHTELDAQRMLITQAQQRILALEQQEQARLGINSLKIRYNQIYGYYLEITKPNLSLVPPEYTRLQTLVNCERFISPALQSLQAAITTAQSTLGDLEQQLFAQVKLAVEAQLTPLRKLAQALATLDTLSAFATVAHTHQYVCPSFNQAREIKLTAGRHPLVAAQLGQNFIANDTSLTDQASLWVITGPNMGGKSTYLRQVALITIMAQCGSFVPAAVADLALVDRIFTRIGAGDYLSQGKSTFLVEMEETALICQLATKNSLVILDEVGRGTSTFDGLAIAQAVIEYLYQQVEARCLFATHYHELTRLAAQFPGIVNYCAQSQLTADGLILLHQIVPGVAQSSFGIEVAKLAQLPAPIITRAQALLAELEQGNEVTTIQSNCAGVLTPEVAALPVAEIADVSVARLYNTLKSHTVARPERSEAQSRDVANIDFAKSPLIPARHLAFLAQLEKLDYEQLSPRQAFDLLWQFKSD